MIAAGFLIALGVYLAGGFVFAIPFALVGVKQIDPHAARGSWGFRLLIIPGTMALWPLLLKRWAGGSHQPPEERTVHRKIAAGVSQSRRRDELRSESTESQRRVTSAPADRT